MVFMSKYLKSIFVYILFNYFVRIRGFWTHHDENDEKMLFSLNITKCGLLCIIV